MEDVIAKWDTKEEGKEKCNEKDSKKPPKPASKNVLGVIELNIYIDWSDKDKENAMRLS